MDRTTGCAILCQDTGICSTLGTHTIVRRHKPVLIRVPGPSLSQKFIKHWPSILWSNTQKALALTGEETGDVTKLGSSLHFCPFTRPFSVLTRLKILSPLVMKLGMRKLKSQLSILWTGFPIQFHDITKTETNGNYIPKEKQVLWKVRYS